MEAGRFRTAASRRSNPNYEELVKRQSAIYSRPDDIRSEFSRDYTRVINSFAFRRLKHKTQVFYNAAGNDHVCTRSEHAAHVESVARTICAFMGLNTELASAIATAHDLGHAPFGHQGEKFINKLSQKYLGESFWHEKNGLRLVDEVEILKDNYNHYRNLDLTYAVRDGIISHCGENIAFPMRPRDYLIDLAQDFQEPGQHMPFTWEGVVVKLADTIAYLGRDIEDAITLGLLDRAQLKLLEEMARVNDDHAVNSTVITHNLIIDVCRNSNPDEGIYLSPRYQGQLEQVKAFNEKYIYSHSKLKPFERYAHLVINELFIALTDVYDGDRTFERIKEKKRFYHELMTGFGGWLSHYVTTPTARMEAAGFERHECDNKKIYGDLRDQKEYIRAVIDYIAGMTDSYAIRVYEELLKY